MVFHTPEGIVVSFSQFAIFPFDWAQYYCVSPQVPYTVSPEVFSGKASAERQQWPTQTHSLGWLRRIASAWKHCTPEVCCHGEKETEMFQLLLCLLLTHAVLEVCNIWKCNREKMARWDQFKRDHFHFLCVNYYCELSFTLFCTRDYTVHWKTKQKVQCTVMQCKSPTKVLPYLEFSVFVLTAAVVVSLCWTALYWRVFLILCLPYLHIWRNKNPTPVIHYSTATIQSTVWKLP